MIANYQGTVPAMAEEFGYSFPTGLPNETTGGSPGKCFLSPIEPSSLIGQAWEVTRQTGDKRVAEEARQLLSIIHDMTKSLQDSGIDFAYLPPFRASHVDDGSILTEWSFPDFRIGFSTEADPEDSGWYLVSNRNLGDISASGYTKNIDFSTLFSWLLEFVLSNT